jgi:hypothetical protein
MHERALRFLPVGGQEVGTCDDEIYAALDRAAEAGLVEKLTHRQKYGETWWRLNEAGKAARAALASPGKVVPSQR